METKREDRREELRRAYNYLHLAAAEAGNSDKAIVMRIIQAIALVENAMNPEEPIQEQEVAV